MPKVFAIWMPTDPVLDVIFPLLARLIPTFLRSFAIVGMDRLEPIEPEALVGAKPSKRNPLWARPGSIPIGPCQEDKLGDTSGQQPKASLAFSHAFFRPVLLSLITCDLDEACLCLERHEKARRPKSRAITSLMPAII